MAAQKRGRLPSGLAKGDPMARLEVVIGGRVQGVGFRYFVLREAKRLGLAGWVANLPDGGVRCVAEGPKPSLEALAKALSAGPPGAHVADIALQWGPPIDATDRFEVRSGAHSGD